MKTHRIAGAFALILLLAMSGNLALAESTDWPGDRAQWQGYDCVNFKINDVQAKVVFPKKTAEGGPWIWRTRFFGHEPQTDIAPLEKGFHVAYINVGGLYGCPKAVEIGNSLHAYMVERGLSEQPVLEGMSRGGLIVMNWAIANPTKVTAIYIDAPVLDFKSWPGGLGKGKGGGSCWNQCLDVYGITEEEAKTYPQPLDKLEGLAKLKIPIISVCGAADDVVPLEENSAILEKRYKALGGPIRLISKPGIGHHPHSLKDPKEIVDFIMAAWDAE